MKVHGTEWKKSVLEFASMEHVQWQNTVEMLSKLKQLLLMLNMFTVAFTEMLYPLEKCWPFQRQLWSKLLKLWISLIPEQCIQDYFWFYVMKWAASMINVFFIRKLVAVTGECVRSPIWTSFWCAKFSLQHHLRLEQSLHWWNVAFPTCQPGRYILPSQWA
jgi:hypothetical protein